MTFPFTPYLVLWSTKLTDTAKQVTSNKNTFHNWTFSFEWCVCSSIQPLNTLNCSQRSLNAGLCVTGMSSKLHDSECYFFAKEIFIALLCVILKPCSASLAAPACTSLSNSTKAMSWRPGTRRTSLNPGNLWEESNIIISKRLCILKVTVLDGEVDLQTNTHWLNSMDSMSSLVSSGRLVRNRMWLGGFSDTYKQNER